MLEHLLSLKRIGKEEKMTELLLLCLEKDDELKSFNFILNCYIKNYKCIIDVVNLGPIINKIAEKDNCDAFKSIYDKNIFKLTSRIAVKVCDTTDYKNILINHMIRNKKIMVDNEIKTDNDNKISYVNALIVYLSNYYCINILQFLYDNGGDLSYIFTLNNLCENVENHWSTQAIPETHSSSIILDNKTDILCALFKNACINNNIDTIEKIINNENFDTGTMIDFTVFVGSSAKIKSNRSRDTIMTILNKKNDTNGSGMSFSWLN